MRIFSSDRLASLVLKVNMPCLFFDNFESACRKRKKRKILMKERRK